mmetsp:Transcript_1918/g.5055  ORF Transcript_1918/g.5055 Transcript_1918/m.5055 type:complete len:101 (-) Transcript_1918:546-848(-)
MPYQLHQSASFLFRPLTRVATGMIYLNVYRQAFATKSSKKIQSEGAIAASTFAISPVIMAEEKEYERPQENQQQQQQQRYHSQYKSFTKRRHPPRPTRPR